MEAALIILDGWGCNPDEDARDAVRAAETPNFDRYHDRGATTTLETHGRRVGLPDGQMGNSEVGHLNVGAGRVVKQDVTRITDAIEDGSFFDNDRLTDALGYAADNDGRVHCMGLVSDGGVHAEQQHLHALVEMAADHGVEAITHAFTDGRDTPPKSGVDYLRDLQEHVDEVGTGTVATVSGRYYAMDRDENWERTKRAYDAIVHREADHTAATAVDAVEASYERGDTDEFVEPTVVESDPDENLGVRDGDAVVFVNFRADRARQLTRMLAGVRSDDWAFDADPPDVRLVTMTDYDPTFGLPVAFEPTQPDDVLGEVLSETGHTQLRIAETEKYAHVTYFLNGGREVEFPGEIRRIVPSPDVPTYDRQPEMSAPEVTDTAIEVVADDDPDAMVCNYANPDMVGHTGDYGAAIAACEAVDEQLGRLVDAVQAAGSHVVITADHGNADDMGTPDDPHTAHTTNPVPVIYLAPDGSDGSRTLEDGGALCNLAPTLLELMDVEVPAAMTCESLLE